MKLYVMRHGPAEDIAGSGLDEDRALTASGRDRVRHVAKTLVDAQEVPLRILTSPLVRAVQTAEIVALIGRVDAQAGARDVALEVRREAHPSGNLKGLVEDLLDEGAKRVMLVGHEPQLSDLVQALLGVFPRSFDK